MKALVTALATTTAILASTPVAMAEYFIPPSNSAATQYTEALPTAGGGSNTNPSGSKHGTTDKVLGNRNAAKLDAQGPEGRAAAEVAAATAPKRLTAETGGEGSSSSNLGSRGAGNSPATARTSSAEPSGSSALEEIAGNATGLSTDSSGLLLPLMITAAIGWALIYRLRQRKRPPA